MPDVVRPFTFWVVITMLRLFLDQNDGVGVIPCPKCGRPLLLAKERKGRWVVAYRGWVPVRPGRQAMLVCADVNCDHREEVEIAETPDDAVVFSASSASGIFSVQERAYELTLDECGRRLQQLLEMYHETHHPKLPSAIKFWREHYSFEYWQIKDYLEQSCAEEKEIVCSGVDWLEQGRVTAILHDGVLLERSATGETIFLRAGDMRSVSFYVDFWRRREFDFSEPTRTLSGNHTYYTPNRYVLIGGYRLWLDGVTRYGMCKVRSQDSATAQALGLMPTYKDTYMGEFPGALTDGVFRWVRYGRVGGFRLHLLSNTKDPDIFQFETRNMEAARTLKMGRSLQWLGQRKALRWWGFFHRDQVTDWEELSIPVRMPRPRRR